MKRYVSLEEISDGKLYQDNDMVKADCHGCKGCSKCCRGMGSSITLDPLDIFRLCRHLGASFEELLQSAVELNVVDGVILPNLKMAGEDERCAFLDDEGWCAVHEDRPGICRIFPLGRYYENGDFKYFLQTGECDDKTRSKIKVSKWVDTGNLKRNRAFINTWHELLNTMEEKLAKADDAGKNALNIALLKNFYFREYDTSADFYEQFDAALEEFAFSE